MDTCPESALRKRNRILPVSYTHLQVQAVNSAGATQTQAINTAGVAQVQAVENEGTEQVANVQEAAAEIKADRDQIEMNWELASSAAPGIVRTAEGSSIAAVSYTHLGKCCLLLPP